MVTLKETREMTLLPGFSGERQKSRSPQGGCGSGLGLVQERAGSRPRWELVPCQSTTDVSWTAGTLSDLRMSLLLVPGGDSTGQSNVDTDRAAGQLGRGPRGSPHGQEGMGRLSG